MKYAIETFDLKKQYKNFIAVNSINMKIPNKTIFGMLGPNGAGKTTTIKMLTCLAQPTSGTATVGGFDVKENPDEVRELLGMVPQQVSLYKDLTVKEMQNYVPIIMVFLLMKNSIELMTLWNL